MCNERSDKFGFAAAYDAPIPYIQRIRDYYVALGYGAPYESRRSHDRLRRHQIAGNSQKSEIQPAPYNAAAKFYTVYSGDTAKDHDLRISHVSIDRKHTTAEDPGSYFPLQELRRAAQRGRIGGVAGRFHGLPTNRSHRVTIEVDCPEVVTRCKADGVDAAILVANCPVCHQSVTLAARHLEEAGIATVVMGCAKDIVEYVGAPRLLFSDFPLGNGVGRPKDADSQAFSLELALKVLETAPAARATVQSPLVWSADPDWKLDYCDIARLSPEEIARRRADVDKQKRVAKSVRDGAGPATSDSDATIA